MGFDAVLVPGGGLSAQGEPADWVKARLDAALAAPGKPWILPLSAGTTHKPPQLSPQGFPLFESIAGARYLVSRGCAPERILTDTWSLDTIGNAFLSRLMHCDPRALGALLIVTSEFHMRRTKAIFDWVFSLTPCPVPFQLSYQSVPNSGLPSEVLEARLEKEHLSIREVEARRRTIRSVGQMHRFVFLEHAAYRVDLEPGAGAAGNWTSSY